eukprot:CAMPEP_0119039330 /NCGR_PEP_ID=MMETSP1177-20130426/8750_1 /TAXON_ID=2985 /ORGANISM="Ochromonas sp, Strain CCMP1899" /LENGTH=77 /DNA_ID=CAMNT_0007003055 /DNA_START=308 /DNA_END=541 /DNA_ORIENTATION=-
MKDGKDPEALADKDYPEWVLGLTEKLPTLNQLLKMVDEAGGPDGDLSVMGEKNLKRAKRLIGNKTIKENNAMSVGTK